jgi:lipopolysaccharide/colanic/teichoic acid biosynthesis glycosyltransferase
MFDSVEESIKPVLANNVVADENTAISPIKTIDFRKKRILDYVFAVALLIALALPLLVIALIIKCDSQGPVFFRQKRVGLDNQVFLIWKFRTMYHYNDPDSKDGSRQAMRNDPRITRIGKWLRKTGSDELPQLLNVIKGEMSLIGPRPHPIKMNVDGVPVDKVILNYNERHRMLPGITGWAQVNGWRGETIQKEQLLQRVAHDLYYIDNWSLRFDMQILLLTILREVISTTAF